MALSPIQTPFTPQELADGVNDNINELDQTKADVTDLANYIPTSQKGANGGVATLDGSGSVVQKANAAKQADDYNPSSGTIQAKFGTVDSAIASIINGNTTVGLAVDLDPAAPPGGDMVYGTSPSGTIGWFPMPGAGGSSALDKEPFTIDDERWDSGVSGVYTLTIPHSGGYPLAAFMTNGGSDKLVSVDIQRDGTNAYILANATFAGYLILG